MIAMYDHANDTNVEKLLAGHWRRAVAADLICLEPCGPARPRLDRQLCATGKRAKTRQMFSNVLPLRYCFRTDLHASHWSAQPAEPSTTAFAKPRQSRNCLATSPSRADLCELTFATCATLRSSLSVRSIQSCGLRCSKAGVGLGVWAAAALNAAFQWLQVQGPKGCRQQRPWWSHAALGDHQRRSRRGTAANEGHCHHGPPAGVFSILNKR